VRRLKIIRGTTESDFAGRKRRQTGRMTKTFCPTFDKQSQIVDRIVCELLLFRAVCSGPLITPSHSSTAAYTYTTPHTLYYLYITCITSCYTVDLVYFSCLQLLHFLLTVGKTAKTSSSYHTVQDST